MNRVQKRTLRGIDRRIEAPKEINGAEMRARMRYVVRVQYIPWNVVSEWIRHCGAEEKGRDGLAGLNLDQMGDLLYAWTWCKAWGKSMQDYLNGFGVSRCKELSE